MTICKSNNNVPPVVYVNVIYNKENKHSLLKIKKLHQIHHHVVVTHLVLKNKALMLL